MRRTIRDRGGDRGKAAGLLEYGLLAVWLCVLAIRVTYTEGISVGTSGAVGGVGDEAYSLWVTGVLLGSFGLWVLVRCLSGRLVYRVSGMELGFCIFLAAAVISSFLAAEKRAAINNAVMLMGAAVSAPMLVQILDDEQKVRLVLTVVAALGVVTTYQCGEQFLHSNEMAIEEYERNPASFLGPLGIEAGTFEHFLFEHRLYSRGVRGFFTTRNSAGSFLVMALFAVMGLSAGRLRGLQKLGRERAGLWWGLGGAGVILLGVVLTRSKGAIGGLVVGAVVWGLWRWRGQWLWAHRRAIVGGVVWAGVAIVTAVVWYGVQTGWRGVGSSMLVRWQYWQGAAKMIAEHGLIGVGPGNFGQYYSCYKSSSALEVVSDPHNFVLSVLSQYGVVGLVGFAAMLIGPMWRAIRGPWGRERVAAEKDGERWRRLVVSLSVILAAVLLVVRPGLLNVNLGEVYGVSGVMYVVLSFYVAPVAVLVIAMALFGQLAWRGVRSAEAAGREIAAACLCGVGAVLVHNLTDFALFEPGVFMTLWGLIGCAAAAAVNASGERVIVLELKRRWVWAAIGVICLGGWGYGRHVLGPVVSSNKKVQQAMVMAAAGRYDAAGKLFEAASEQDRLSSTALTLAGRAYLRQGEKTTDASKWLEQAERMFRAAIERNPARYKNFEYLAEVYRLEAESADQQQRQDRLAKAFDALSEAIRRYPGCGRLWLKRGKIAEQLGDRSAALEGYAKAIKIEEGYRQQFRSMYPERTRPVSRLGEKDYEFAKRRLQELSQGEGEQVEEKVRD